MVKYLVMGAAVGAAILLPAGFALWLAHAQEQPAVPLQCPQNPVWMEGFGFQNLVKLNPRQYRSARVNVSDGRVRDRAGFESNVAFTLPRNATVTVIGEAWDTGCNQWMRVRTDRGDYWMHGNTLADDPSLSAIGPVDEPVPVTISTTALLITDLCPKAVWTEGYRINQPIPLAKSQFHSAVANENNTQLRRQARFDAPAMVTLNAGEPMTIVGETWDGDCTQWMQVQFQGEPYWVHGNLVRR